MLADVTCDYCNRRILIESNLIRHESIFICTRCAELQLLGQDPAA